MSRPSAGKAGAPTAARRREPSSRRLRRERRTVEVMIRMYCRAHHATPPGTAGERRPGSRELCPRCAALLDYSDRRVAECRFGRQKPTCARCLVHCFKADEREAIRQVMRYAGPRMTLRHTYLAMRHILDRRAAAG